MNRIEAYILNPQAVQESEKLMVCAARLTQKGEKIKKLDDFLNLYGKDATVELKERLVELPHPTIQKFGLINAVVVGASRRFLAQITRHQNEVKFMSASLQYSDYSGKADFVVPYEYVNNMVLTELYIETCSKAMAAYEAFVSAGYSGDSAGYMAPQGLRNVLIISATPYQWKHMIGQRTCRRNTDETRYVMLRIWERLYELSQTLFSPRVTGPFCMRGTCAENEMTCGKGLAAELTPREIIEKDFPKLV